MVDDAAVVDAGAASGSGGWHSALTYAVTGRPRPDLGLQHAPDLAELASRLLSAQGAEPLLDHVRETLAAGRPWPHPVPPELMAGLGYAQFAAALTQLRSELGLDGPRLVARSRPARGPLTAEERRLLEDVPPHHGG